MKLSVLQTTFGVGVGGGGGEIKFRTIVEQHRRQDGAPRTNDGLNRVSLSPLSPQTTALLYHIPSL